MAELTITSTTDNADDVREAVSQVAEVEQEEIDGASDTEAHAHGETHESAQESPEEHAGEQPKRKTGFQRRVDRLTREKYELLERN